MAVKWMVFNYFCSLQNALFNRSVFV